MAFMHAHFRNKGFVVVRVDSCQSVLYCTVSIIIIFFFETDPAAIHAYTLHISVQLLRIY